MNDSLREALTRGAERLSAAGIETPRTDARVLLAHAFGVTPEALLAHDSSDASGFAAFESSLLRRAAREPVAYITGSKEFWSLPFDVGPGVLIPRPESETLVEEALRSFPDPAARLRVLDLGTGSGCLLIAFLSGRVLATGLGIDASEAALAYARRNAHRQRLRERCDFLLADWSAPLHGTFDLIFANPPYLSEAECDRCEPEIREHEPKVALTAGRDGLEAIRALGPVLSRHLKARGLAFVEIGFSHAATVGPILEAWGLEVRRIAPDLSGASRCFIVGLAGAAARGPKKISWKEPCDSIASS